MEVGVRDAFQRRVWRGTGSLTGCAVQKLQSEKLRDPTGKGRAGRSAVWGLELDPEEREMLVDCEIPVA